MTLHIELKPEEERVLLERARLSGRDPAQYAQQIIRDHIATPAHEATRDEADAAEKPLWEVITDIARRVPDEEWAKIPSDASYQLDHYLYGAPKKPAP